MEQFDALLAQTIDSTLGMICKWYGYQYSEILRSLMCVYLCGGSCVEDVTTHLMRHLSLHPSLRTCSADTILRAIEELTCENTTYQTAISSTFPSTAKKLSVILGGTASVKLCNTQDLRLILNPFFQSKAIQGVYDISPIFRMDAKLQWSSHDGKWGMRLNGSNIFNNRFDTRSVQGNQDYRMKINFNWASVTFAVIYKFGGYKEKNVKAVDTSRMGH